MHFGLTRIKVNCMRWIIQEKVNLVNNVHNNTDTDDTKVVYNETLVTFALSSSAHPHFQKSPTLEQSN